MSMIHIEDLTKAFGDNVILEHIHLDIEKGECVSIIGPSGCGKSTLLRCMNLLEAPTSGRVFIGGQEITAKGAPLDDIRRHMGMVYQSFNLFSHKTVLENVMMAPMALGGLSKQEAMALAMDCLDQVGMGERADFLPSALSGGQKQRAAIARCIAMKPELILFDEPTSALDPTMVDEVLAVIRRLVNQGMTCVIVTHEMNFARNISSRVVYLDEKGIYEMGPPSQIFDAPLREKTQAFVERIRTLRWSIRSREFDIYELNRAAALFCRKQLLDERQIYRVQLALEELLCNLLLPNLPEKEVQAELALFYRGKDGGLTLRVDYSGTPVSQEAAAGNDLSMTMLTAIGKELQWEENRILLRF